MWQVIKPKVYFLALLFLLPLFDLTYCNAYATDSPLDQTTVETNTTGFTVSPSVKRIALDPGDHKEEKLTVSNKTNQTKSFYVYATPYSETNNGAGKDFDQENQYNQIYRWIKVQNDNKGYTKKAEISVKPGETREVQFSINVPDDASVSGQYASIFVEAIPEDQNTGTVHAIGRIGMLLYASISGEYYNETEITQTKTGIFDTKVGVNSTISNKGNIDVQATADLKVSSIFGEELYRHTGSIAVLPENSKSILVVWEETPANGIFRVEYKVKALDAIETKSQLVIVLSPWLIIGIILLVFVAIYVFVRISRNFTTNVV